MDFSFLSKYYMFYLLGAKNTLLIALLVVVLGTLLGTLLALMKLSDTSVMEKPTDYIKVALKSLATAYIEFVRGTPLMVQLLVIYFGFQIPFPEIKFLSYILGMNSSDFFAGVFVLSLNSGAYVAEIIRAGIQAVDKGQMEASRSLGMPLWMAMQHIIIPQAFRNILPALGNEFIVVVKESSIVMIIGIKELMYNADTVRGNTFIPLEPLLVAAVIYFIMTFTLSKGLNLLERRLTRDKR